MRRRFIVVTLVVLLVLLGTLPTLAAIVTRENSTTITIAESGAASPFPSTIEVGGLTGIISDVNVTLSGLSHENVTDVNILLVGPTGQSVMLMDDVGAVNGRPTNSVTLTFDDAAPNALPQDIDGEVMFGTYKPTASDGDPTDCNDTAPPPSTPTGPHGTALAAFNGTNPNGTWSLFVYDDCTTGGGSIEGGWSLEISAPGLAVNVPDNITVVNDPGLPGAVVAFTATGSGEDDNPATPTCNPPSGSFFEIGTTTVTCTLSSENGREASDTFTVTVNDSELPVLTLPGDITVDADGPTGTAVTYNVSASDNSGEVTLDCEPSSGTLFPVGETTVNCIVTDSSNNSVSGSFIVTVTAQENPSDLLSQLRADTIALVDTSSTERSMVTSLDIAQYAINQGNTWLARLALAQYELLLQREISTRRISASDGQLLRHQLQQVISSIS